jgi:hypothetical protein
MTRRHIALLLSGWTAFFYLAFCSSPVSVSVDISPSPDQSPLQDAFAEDERVYWPEAPKGTLSVLDATGTLVGVLVSRTHPQRDDSDLYDAVQVFSPEHNLFFGIHMKTAKTILPAKVMFKQGNCAGTAGIRATCPDCFSGYDLGFSYGSTWYRVAGGAERESFTYSSYIPPESDGKCTGHGMSNTYVYPAEVISLTESPAPFVPPLHFVWQ